MDRFWLAVGCLVFVGVVIGVYYAVKKTQNLGIVIAVTCAGGLFLFLFIVYFTQSNEAKLDEQLPQQHGHAVSQDPENEAHQLAQLQEHEANDLALVRKELDDEMLALVKQKRNPKLTEQHRKNLDDRILGLQHQSAKLEQYETGLRSPSPHKPVVEPFWKIRAKIRADSRQKARHDLDTLQQGIKQPDLTEDEKDRLQYRIDEQQQRIMELEREEAEIRANAH